MNRDLERLARRAAGGDLVSAKRLLAEVMARSPAVSEEERGLYAVSRVCDGESETLSLHHERRSALAAAAAEAAKALHSLRDGWLTEPPRYAEFDRAFESGNFGDALDLWNTLLNGDQKRLGHERVAFWVEGPIPLRA